MFVVENNYKTTNNDNYVIQEYKKAFTLLPEILKRNISYIKFWSSNTWLKNNITGDHKHNMACTDWGNAVNSKSPIYIDLGKPAYSNLDTKPSHAQFRYYEVAAHEAGHALDTVNKKYSNTSTWKNITKKYGAKIYSIDSKTTYEVFAAAVSWYVTNPNKLISISIDAYNYINNIFNGGIF